MILSIASTAPIMHLRDMVANGPMIINVLKAHQTSLIFTVRYHHNGFNILQNVKTHITYANLILWALFQQIVKHIFKWFHEIIKQ